MAPQKDIEEKKTELQKAIGASPAVSIGEFTNWSTSRNTEHLLVVKPKSLQEVQSVVKAARQLKLQIRCAGSMHSWAPLFPDEGNILMYVKDIKRHDGPDIEVIRNDDDIRVNVMGGITVDQLMDVEKKEKINLTANVVLREPTYAGIVGAGCHGVGWDFQSVSDFCVQMRIVDSDGELRTFSKTEDGEMMKAVQCNLGMFGVIYDMQLQVLEQKLVHTRNDFSYKVGDIFYDKKNLKELVESNDSVEIFIWPFSSVGWIDATEQITALLGSSQTLTRDEWDPKQDGCWVRKINIPADQSSIPQCEVKKGVYYEYMDIRSWLEAKVSSFADDFIVNMPEGITPLACKAAYNTVKEANNGDVYQELVEAIHFRDNIGIFSVGDMEWCFDNDKNYNNVTKAVQSVIEIVRTEAENARFPLNMVIEMRWMKDSDVTLCPAIMGNKALGGSGHTVYIEVLSYTNTPGWNDFSNKVAKEWMKIPGSRPHWAKEWDNINNITPYLQKVWSKQFAQFRAALDKSKCDPDGLFLNNKLKEIFFPGKKFAITGNADPEPEDKVTKKSNPAATGEEKKSSTCALL